MAANCNYKLLKDAHIGQRVRMTSDKSTIPFENKPMSGMKIVDYNKMGFKISHPNMGKIIWVDFFQLPLTELTIINGVIQDEITFVENIVAHQMELIKTSNPEYQELLKIKEEEEFEEFCTLSDIKPGEMVISALCKEGVPMTYIGTWFTKTIIRDHSRRYNNYVKDKFYLNKQSPKRAFFIVDSENLTPSEEDYIDSIGKDEEPEQYKDEDWDDFYDRSNEWWDKKYDSYFLSDKKYELEDIAKKEFLEKGSKNRYKIISYPITSKKVKKLIKTNVFNEKFTILDFNKEIIMYVAGQYDGSYYGSKEDNDLIELKETYPKPKYDVFLIVNNKWDLKDSRFLCETKENINDKAFEFFDDNYMCKLEHSKLINNNEIEDIVNDTTNN